MTAFWLNLSLGTAGGILFYFTGMMFIEHLLTVPADLKPEIETALPWVACVLPLALVSGLGFGALESRERFLSANVLQVVGPTAGLVVPLLCAVFISPRLSVVVPAAVMALQRERPLSPRNFDWQRCRALLSYGGWTSVTNFIGQFLASADELTIGSVLGVTAVAHYSVPMSLVVHSQLLAAALSRTLFPRRPDIGAKIRALAIIPFLCVLWFSLNQFGLMGAAAAWDLMVTIAAGCAFISMRFNPPHLVQLISPAGVGASALVFDTRSRAFVASLRIPRRSLGVLAKSS